MVDGNEIHNLDIDLLLSIHLTPDPDQEVLFSGTVLTVETKEVDNVFVDTPRLVFIQFRNGSTSQLGCESPVPFSLKISITSEIFTLNCCSCKKKND